MSWRARHPMRVRVWPARVNCVRSDRHKISDRGVSRATMVPLVLLFFLAPKQGRSSRRHMFTVMLGVFLLVTSAIRSYETITLGSFPRRNNLDNNDAIIHSILPEQVFLDYDDDLPSRRTSLLDRISRAVRLGRRHPNKQEELSPAESESSSLSDAATTSSSLLAMDQQERILHSLVEPIISHDVWDILTGQEFQQHHPKLLDGLVALGERMAMHDASDEYIDWSPYKSYNAQSIQHDGAIHVWTGKSKVDGYGSKSPWIKTRSIVPLTPQEMAELLLDSSRVKTYNQWSTGRQDLVMIDGELTKIVKNRTQPPIGSKSMQSVTVMHARPLNEYTWIVVSRAVGGSQYYDPDEGRSDILLGVNLFQAYDDDSCIVTAITHVYSTAVPSMLAEQLGVKGATKFIKDMRNSKVAA